MNFDRIYKRPFILAALAALCVLLLSPAARAADPTVALKLSSDTAAVGESVELTLEITGAQSGQIPNKIEVDGLSINYSGQSTSYRIENFNAPIRTSSVIFQVTPQREGKFTIPALTMELDGKKITTNSATLTVAAAGHAPGGGNARDGSGKPLLFAELVTPKQTAYVGEVLPLEFRFYHDERVRILQFQPEPMKADGFTILKTKEDQQRADEKDGRRYIVNTLHTAVIPQKSGQLSIAPLVLHLAAQLPEARKPQQMPGSMDDYFNDNMFPGFIQPKRLDVSSEETKFDIKPLPKEGQPKDFAGAVGQFKITTEASPLKLKAGDPVTVKFKISGQGNFDRVTAPVMASESGWNTYPPSVKFTEDDELGMSGSKVFEMALIPTEQKSELPVFEFSYFDPATGKYITLKSDRLPIVVEGAPPASAQPSAPPVTAATNTKSSPDIHYIATGPAAWGVKFTSLFQQQIFWTSQAAPALGFLAFIGLRIKRRRAGDTRATLLATRRKEMGELMKTLQRRDIDQAAFYDAAVRHLQAATAADTALNPGSVGLTDAINSRPLDHATREGVQSIFNAHGELRYAGVEATRQKLPDARRDEVLETLRRFENAKA